MRGDSVKKNAQIIYRQVCETFSSLKIDVGSLKTPGQVSCIVEESRQGELKQCAALWRVSVPASLKFLPLLLSEKDCNLKG